MFLVSSSSSSLLWEREREQDAQMKDPGKKKEKKKRKRRKKLTLRRGLPAELRSHGNDRDGQADPVGVAEAERGRERGDDAGKGRAEREEVGVGYL